MTSPTPRTGRDQMTSGDDRRIVPDDDPIILDEQFGADDNQIVLDNDEPADPAGQAAGPRPVAGSATVITDLPPSAGQASPAAATPSGTGTPPASVAGSPSDAGAGAGPAGGGASPSARWPEIQAMFVDDPQASVELAAGLTDDSVEALIGTLKERQHALSSAWQGSGGAGTEELRTALQGYRAFWKRLEEFSVNS